MTTIAYRDGVLAADSQVSSISGSRFGTKSKITRTAGGLLAAACGDSGWVSSFLRWADQFVGAPDQLGSAVPECAEESEGWLVDPRTDALWIVSGGRHFWQLDAQFHAAGSGGRVAIGAMARGATAVEAVEIAIQFDIYTGGPVQALSLRRGDLESVEDR